MNKEYLTIQKQIDHLVNDKNIDRATIQESYFKEQTYLDLVNPYSDIVSIGRDPETKNHVYEKLESFDKFIECNHIDDSICCFLRHALGAFEKSFKSFLMNIYCKKMCDEGDVQVKDYSWIERYKRNEDVFDLVPLGYQHYRGATVVLDSTDGKYLKRIEVLDEILAESQNPNPSNLMAKHYLNKYGYIPMFVVVHTLSLGKLLSLFDMLPLDDKISFIRFYFNDDNKKVDGMHVDKIEKDFKTLVIIRNITNHYEPIFPFILNYHQNSFKSLLDVLSALKNHYSRCLTLSKVSFDDLHHFSFDSNSYSSPKIERIHKVIDAIG